MMSPYFVSGVPVAVERRQKRRDRKAIELDVKARVKKRDGHQCRWPACEYRTVPQLIDAAHLDPAGMGGDPQSLRMTTDNLISICRLHHRKAPVSMHSGDLKIEPVTESGADGLCAFYRLNRETGFFEHIATEKRIGVSETRGQ